MTHEPVAVGVIGAGFIAQIAHLPAFGRLEGCRIAALADNRPDLLDQVADRHNIPARFADYRNLLADADIDAVVVSMPRRAQSAVVRNVLQAHVPVLTEKPMAYTSAVAHELIALAESSSTELAVGYMRRFDPGVAMFRNLLVEAGGDMGEPLHVRLGDFCGAYSVPAPYHVRSRCPFLHPEDPPAPSFIADDLHAAYDYTVNVASHDLNLLRYLFGDTMAPVSFRVRAGKAQHAIFATTGFDLELSVGPADVGVWEQRIDVYFAKGCLSLVLADSLAGQACATVVRRRPGREEVLRPPVADRLSAFELQAAGFLDALRGGEAFAASGADAAKDVDTIEAMWRIASLG